MFNIAKFIGLSAILLCSACAGSSQVGTGDESSTETANDTGSETSTDSVTDTASDTDTSVSLENIATDGNISLDDQYFVGTWQITAYQITTGDLYEDNPTFSLDNGIFSATSDDAINDADAYPLLFYTADQIAVPEEACGTGMCPRCSDAINQGQIYSYYDISANYEYTNTTGFNPKFVVTVAGMECPGVGGSSDGELIDCDEETALHPCVSFEDTFDFTIIGSNENAFYTQRNGYDILLQRQ